MTNPIDWSTLLKLTNNRLKPTKELLDIFSIELSLLRLALMLHIK